MSKYIQFVKSIVDNLAAVVNLIADSGLVSNLLSGLSPEYNSFVTSVNTGVDPVLSEELIGLMLSQEIYRVHAITSPDSTTLISPSPRFILFPALQATIQLHLFLWSWMWLRQGARSWSWMFLLAVTSVHRWPTSMPDL